MSLDSKVRQALVELAGEAGTPGYAAALADDALRAGNRRARTRTLTALGTLAVVVALAAPFALTGRHPVAVTAGPSGHPTSTAQPSIAPVHRHTVPGSWQPLRLSHPHTGDTSISAHPNESPPVHFVAADDVAVSAYYFETVTDGTVQYTWYLYDPRTGTYRHTPYASLAVAPGLGLAAVLEHPGANNRVGILDMQTQSVVRWISTGVGVGSVAFSPDGTKLVTTVFGGETVETEGQLVDEIIVIDLATGAQDLQSITTPGLSGPPFGGARWTNDGSYIYVIMIGTDGALRLFFDPTGHPVPTPPHAEQLAIYTEDAGISPDGTKYGSYPDSRSLDPQTAVRDLATGQVVASQPMQVLVAWADNTALVGEYCALPCTNEFHGQLAVTSLNGGSVTPLTGPLTGADDRSPQQWRALLTHR